MEMASRRTFRILVCQLILLTLVLFLVSSPLILAYHLYSLATDTIQTILNDRGMSQIPFIKDLIAEAKAGGAAKIQQHTLERFFLISYPLLDTTDQNKPGTLSFLGLDVSHGGESSYIQKRILTRPDFTYKKLIVDIGANDGFVYSNSLNFIQWGWDAILVEPQPDQIKNAKINTQRYRDPYNDHQQKIHFVHAVIGQTDGTADIVISTDAGHMQTHIQSDQSPKLKDQEYTITVASITVATLAEKYNIPQKFGILSIDTEGLGDKILHTWIQLGYRPAYIIYENVHNEEDLLRTSRFLADAGYTHIAERGYNQIYELRDLK